MPVLPRSRRTSWSEPREHLRRRRGAHHDSPQRHRLATLRASEPIDAEHPPQQLHPRIPSALDGPLRAGQADAGALSQRDSSLLRNAVDVRATDDIRFTEVDVGSGPNANGSDMSFAGKTFDFSGTVDARCSGSGCVEF